MPAIRRPLTEGERRLAASCFGGAIDYDQVEIVRQKWFPFQPRHVGMTPCGNLHIHPDSPLWSDDFAAADLNLQGFFIHEMTHAWQAQTRGRFYLVLMRHPFCRYDYALKPGRRFEQYGLEQQGDIMRHAFLLSRGALVPGAPPLEQYLSIIPFAFERS